MMKNKKAQSALEFLTTYGWAFLVILIMIGALGYFGILNPTRYLPERCSVNTEFSCEEFSIERTGANQFDLTVVLRNTLGEAIDLNVSAQMIKIRSDILGESGWNNTQNINPSDRAATVGTLRTPTVVNTCTAAGGSAISTDGKFTIAADQLFAVKCRVADTAVTIPGTGNKLRVAFDMVYTPQGRTLSRPIAGEVFGTVQGN